LEKPPWLDYTGQTTPELIACKDSHRIDSLLCAFEEGIQAKLSSPGITAEEELVLAVMALNREVNNGGHHQFFVNSSCKFAPIIVQCLRRIHCDATAAITERAIAALGLPALSVEAASAAIRIENDARDEILDACDREFYQLDEITPKLFDFVQAHQDQIQLIKASLPPRQPLKKLGNASMLHIHLSLTKSADLNLEGLRLLARELARKNSIAATDTEVEGAVVLHAFRRSLRSGDLAACEPLAPLAFELMRDDALHCGSHRDWVEQLIGASKQDLADAAALAYLEYLEGCDQSTLLTQNRILYWAVLLKKQRAALPKSVRFFIASFPHDDLDKPLLQRRFTAEDRPAGSSGSERKPRS